MRTLTCLALLPLAASVAPAQGQPWAENLPERMKTLFVQPERVVNETPCQCREKLREMFLPVVQGCTSTREAVLAVAGNIGAVTGTYYSAERRKANMNAQEALDEKKISCTGQSILMVSIFRSLDIPARAVLLPSWNHVRGNHTWCEAWFEGEWHMIEFNEKDFNTPWVMEGVGMLDPARPEQHIYAVIDFKSGLLEDVSPRYAGLAAAWYKEHGLPADRQKLMVDLRPRTAESETVALADADGKAIATAPLPTERDDMRRFATLELPRTGQYSLQIRGKSYPVKATDSPVQVLRFKRGK